MKVFISWSGEQSKGVAKILHEYIPLILQGVEVFVSAHDIESGARWAHRIAEELASSHFGILCLMPDNLKSEWLLFEAGALTKLVNGKACGLLAHGLSATDVSGPLSQFQHQELGEFGFCALLRDINDAREKPLQGPQVDTLTAKFWPDIKERIDALPKASPLKAHARPVPEVLEELVERVRGLERSVASREEPRESAFSREPFISMSRHEIELTVRDLAKLCPSLDRAARDGQLEQAMSNLDRRAMGLLFQLGVLSVADGKVIVNPVELLQLQAMQRSGSP